MRFAFVTVFFVSCAVSRPVTVPTPAAGAALTLGVDTHLHLTMSQAAKPVFRGEAGDGVLAHAADQRLVNQVTEPQLRAAGVRLVFGALWPPFRARPGVTSLGEAVKQARELDDFVARRPGFAIAHDAASARKLLKAGFIAVVPQLEGGEGIEQPDDVDILYASGVRVVTVMHFVSSQLGGAAKGQVSRALFAGTPGELEPEGLSPVGKDAILRMVQLGMVIDLAHASDRFVSDVLDVTEPLGVPVLVSHTSARGILGFERSVSDALAKRVVASGGLIGVTLADKQLVTDEAHRLPVHQPGTCDDVVAHWKYLASVVPPESLVLGSDVNGFITRAVPGGLCPEGLRNYGDVPQLFGALVENGIPRAALDGMGERLLQLMERVDSRADADAQASAQRRFSIVRDERSTLPMP